MKCREERVAAIGLDIIIFIEYFVGKRQGSDSLSAKCTRPVQDDFQRVSKAGDLQLLDQRQVGRVIADKLPEVLRGRERRPAYGACAIRRIKKIPRLQAAAAGLAGIGKAGLQR